VAVSFFVNTVNTVNNGGNKEYKIIEKKRGWGTFLLQKVASPLFCFNGVNLALPSFRIILSALPQNAENSILCFADLGWLYNNSPFYQLGRGRIHPPRNRRVR